MASFTENGFDVLFYLAEASEEVRGDKDVILAAVREKAEALKYASLELRGDREIVLAACDADEGVALLLADPLIRSSVQRELDRRSETGSASNG